MSRARRLSLRRPAHRTAEPAASSRHDRPTARAGRGAPTVPPRRRPARRLMPVAGEGQAEATAADLRRWALAPWPDAVGVLWPTPSLWGAPTGTMICRACLEQRPRAATGERPDRSRAIVLFGPDAARRVDRRCAVHTLPTEPR